VRDGRWRRRQGDAAVGMLEQGRDGRHTVATRVSDADGRDWWWRRTLKTRWNDGSLAGESAAAIAMVVGRATSADGGAGLSGRIDFLW
jgi:hypothetical protein